MTINHTALAGEIRRILQENTTPGFAAVFGGPIRGLPVGGPYANYRYQGRGNEKSDYPQTLKGQINLTETWTIRVFFVYGDVSATGNPSPERDVLGDFDIAIADADQALQTAFRADATLNGESSPTLTITDSFIDDGLSFPFSKSQSVYSGIRFDLLIKDREAEGTTP